MNHTEIHSGVSRQTIAKKRRVFWTLGRLLVAIVLVDCCACSDDGRRPVFPVSGQVMYHGKPTPDALVIFHPISDPDPSAPRPLTRVNPDGSFTLTTYEMNDGAPAGEYTVTITWVKDIDNGNTAKEDIKPAKHLLPERYSKVETSGLKVEIKKEKNKLAAFNLETQ